MRSFLLIFTQKYIVRACRELTLRTLLDFTSLRSKNNKLINIGLIFSLLFILSSTSYIFASETLEPRVIVKFKKETTLQKREEILKKIQAKRLERLKLRDTVVFSSKELSNETTKQLSNDSNIEYIEPDYVAQAFDIPNDPRVNEQWALTNLKMFDTWKTTYNANNVDIAIVDTGIDPNHPDLKDQIVGRQNFTTNADQDGSGHGTHVAGIAAAVTNNNTGVAGASNARLLSVKVLDDNGRGYYSWIANGIIWAVDNGAEVINISLGGPVNAKTLQEAIDYAWNKGTVVVVASGNDNSSTPVYPAYYESVLAVAATDKLDKKAKFSNYGNWIDIAAPGVNILSTYKNSSYINGSGTSMATPFVSAVAALVKGQHPDWTNDQIRKLLETTTDQIFQNTTFGTFGKINPCRAVGCILPSPLPNPSPTPVASNFNQEPKISLKQFDVEKQWNDSEKLGLVIVKNKFIVTSGILSNLVMQFILDQNGDWKIGNAIASVIVNNNTYQTNILYNEQTHEVSLNLSNIGDFKTGDIVEIKDLKLNTTQRGIHRIKLQITINNQPLYDRIRAFVL